MSDYEMCNQPCPVRSECTRHTAGGAVPDETQAYFPYKPPPKARECKGYRQTPSKVKNASKPLVAKEAR